MNTLFILVVNLARFYIINSQALIQETSLNCNITGQSDCSDPQNIKCSQNYFLFHNYFTGSSLLPQQYCVKCPYQNFIDPLTLYCMDCVENPYTWDYNRQCTYDYQIINGVAVDGVYTRVNRSLSELYFVDAQQSTNTTLASTPITYMCEGCDYFCYNTTILDVSSPCSLIVSSHQNYDPGHTTVACLSGYIAYSGVCYRCVDNCQKCDQYGCIQVSDGYYQLTSYQMFKCSSSIPNCVTCTYNQTSQILYCLSCLKLQSGLQYITSLNLLSCEICGSYCKRCEYTTYNTSLLSLGDIYTYPTRYSFTSDYIIQNANQYIKKCRQCSFQNYTFSSSGTSCQQCSIQNCAKCFYTHQINTNGVAYTYTTNDLDFAPFTYNSTYSCYQCQKNYVLSYQKSICTSLSIASQIQNCSTYQYTDVANTLMICTKCENTFFYNLDTNLCQLHDPNAQTLTSYSYNNGQYILDNSLTTAQKTNLISSLPYITCSTYLSHCLECYLYKSIDVVQTGNTITSAYIYQCANCDDGYYPDIFTGICLLCKASDQVQSCQKCSQYSLSYNYTDVLFTYPRITSSAKSKLQSLESVNVIPLCFQCINGYTFLTQTSGCDACGGNCFTGSCQTSNTETYCKKCWPPSGNFTSRSLSVDHNQCIDCPDNCEGCRVRTTQELNSINADFNTSYTALSKYSLFCYKAGYGQYYDTILGLPVSCALSNSCYKSITLDISLYCSTTDYFANVYRGYQDPSLIYSLPSFYSSSIGTPIISFGYIDNSDTYTLYNAQVVQNLFLNINLIGPSSPTQLCSIQTQTNLQIYFTKNIFCLKNLQVTFQGIAYRNSTNITNYNQSSNTIVTLTSYLNFLSLRNIVIRGLTFIYPLSCTQTLINTMLSSTTPINWGLQIQQNGLTQLRLQSCTFGANTTYLQQMNSSHTFSTNQKLLFQFVMNNVYNLSIIDVNMNYNNFTFNQNTNPLTRTFDIPQLTSRVTFINGLLITGLGLYGVPLFVVNDVATQSQQIKIGPKGLIFLFCNFYLGGHIFGEFENSTSQSGQIDIARMVIQYSSFDQSSIFSLRTNVNNASSIRKVDIIGCNFTNSSYAFHMNNLNLKSIYTYMLLISSSSSIIKSYDNIPDDQIVLANSLNLVLKQIHFSNTQCQTPGCLVILTSPSNTQNLKLNISINGLIIENTDISGIDIKSLQSISTALIQINDINFLIIGNLMSDNNLAVVIISIDAVVVVKFYDSVFNSSQSVINANLSESNSSLPNNLMPVTIACLQAKKAMRQNNNIQIYVNQFSQGVYLQDVVFQNLLALDNTLIYIQSYDALYINTSIIHTPLTNYDISDTILKTTGMVFLAENSAEIIQFIGCQFINNRFVASEKNQYSSIFYTFSQQNQIIVFIDCLFVMNHLHQLTPFQNVPSASCIVIESINSNVAIISSNFTKNSATQAMYGQVYILASKTLMSKSLFIDTNIYEVSWNKRLQSSNLNASQYQQYFQVVSNGGNAYIVSSIIKIQFCSFNRSKGKMGAGLYISSLGIGTINIVYSAFEKQSSSLEYKQQSQGGALYIDSSSSQLNLQIINTDMRGCSARKSGGCIYINTGDQSQQISIKFSNFLNCYALSSSFMEVVFPLTSSSIPIVSFYQIYISQDLKHIQNYYYSIPSLEDSDLNSLTTQNSVYYQYYGIFLMQDSGIQNILYTSALNLQFMTYVDLQQVSIMDSILFWLPLINIQLSTMTAAQIVLSKIEISNTREYSKNDYNSSFCNKPLSQITINDISCDQTSRLLQSIQQSSSQQNTSQQITSQQNTSQQITSQQSSSQLSSSNNRNSDEGASSEESSNGYQMNNNSIQKNNCTNGSTPLNNSRYFDLFSYYYNTLTSILKYGLSDEIEDTQWSKGSQISYDEVVANVDTEFVQDPELKYDQVYQDYMDCQLATLLSILSTNPPMALISIDAISLEQTLTINQLNLLDNDCQRCFGGLIQVLSIATPSQGTLVQISDVTCQNNTSGYYGCLTLSNSKILSAMDNNPGYSNSSQIINRLLQSQKEENKQNYHQGMISRVLVDKKFDEVLIHLQKLSHTVNIEYSNFVQNTASVGAGLSIFGLNTLVSNSGFNDNKATYMGAGLFYYKNSNVNLYLYGITFQGNEAQVGGGIMLVNSSIGDEQLWKIVFSDNIGHEYAANLVEYPQQLSIQITVGNTLPVATFLNYSGERNKYGNVMNTSDIIIDIVNIANYSALGYPGIAQRLILPSGQKISSYQYYHQSTQEQVPFNYIFRIINLNRFHQEVSSVDSSQICTVTGRRQSSIHFNDSLPFQTNYTHPNLFSFDISTGSFNLDDMIIIFDPLLPSTEFLQLKFQCTSVKIPVYSSKIPYNIKGYNTNYFLYLNVSTFPCQVGEYYINVPGKDDGRCLSCGDLPNTFSIIPFSQECTPIDKSTMVSVNPFMIQTKPGYWRPYDDSPIISYCANLDVNCPGGWSTGPDSCYDGHAGALCESCDLKGLRDGNSWAQSAQYKCGKCADLNSQNSLIIVGISVFTLLSIVASVMGNYDVVELFIRNQVLQSLGVLVRNTESFFLFQIQGGLAILVKIFTNYFQIIAAVATFQLSLPAAFSDTVSNVGNPVKSMAVSYDCFFDGITNIEVLYFRIIWAMLMPFFYLCIFFMGYFLAVAIKKAPYKISVIYTTFIYMFIYLQPNLIGGFISLASQRTISGYEWVQADVRYRFDTTTHEAWIGAFVAPNLVIWTFLLPFGLLINLVKTRDTLDSNHTRERWGYFYNEYRSPAYFWEFVKIFQKEMIIIFLIYFQDTIIVKGLLIFFMIFIYGGVALFVKPYQSTLLNFLDIVSTAVCAVSMSGGVLSYAATVNKLDGLSVLFLVIVAIINILFVIQMIILLFHGYIAKFDEKIDAIRIKINDKKPNLVIEYPWLRRFMIIRKDMKLRVDYLWGQLRYETRQGIKRKRIDNSAPLIESRPMKIVEINAIHKSISEQDESDCLIEKQQSQGSLGQREQKTNQTIFRKGSPIKANLRQGSIVGEKLLITSSPQSYSSKISKIHPLLREEQDDIQEK